VRRVHSTVTYFKETTFLITITSSVTYLKKIHIRRILTFSEMSVVTNKIIGSKAIILKQYDI
jgi:hypothetical protein